MASTPEVAVTIDDVASLIRRATRSRRARRSLELDATTRLDDLGLSSLQLADVVFSLEERTGIELDSDRAAGVATLGELVELANTPAHGGDGS